MFFCRKIFQIIFIVSMITSCSVIKPVAIKPVSTYTIAEWPNHDKVKTYPTTKKTLLVTNTMASPGFNTSNMVYVTIPFQLRAFADHRWVASPASLLLRLIANRMSETHYFKAVVTPPFSGFFDYQLNTQLLMLEQEFLKPMSEVRLRMQATLIHAGTGEVIANRVFEVVISAPRNDPYAGVLATNQAAQMLSDQMTEFVIQAAH